MSPFRTFANRILREIGIDPQQYFVLLRLFSTLSDRLEFMGVTAGLRKVLGFYLFFSFILSLGALGNPTLPGYLLVVIGISMFMLLWMLLMDAANSIMNPDEASVLSHQPIRGGTYVAAKLSHIFVIVGAIIPALNVMPAFAGLFLSHSRWFYPLTHLIAAYLAGLFVAFFVCGVYGWLFRIVPPAKLKSAALWLQLITFVVMPILQQIAIITGSHPRGGRTRSIEMLFRSSWMPWHWFVALGLAGHADYPGFSALEAGAACLVTCALIVYGLRAFRMDYMASVSSLLKGGAASKGCPSRTAWISPILRKLTRAPSGYGAFAFTAVMLRRDWNFRRQAVAGILPFLVAPLAAIVGSIRKSPFVAGSFSIRDFSLMHLFPHCLGMALVLTCMLLSYTAEPKGSSVFVSLPLYRLRPFVRGVYASLWVPAMILHICLLAACVWFWGAAEGLLFISFSAALVSAYLGLAMLFIDGMPFTNAFKPSAMSAFPVIFIFGIFGAFFFSIIQWFAFYNTFLVLAAAIILTAFAYFMASISLGRLESKVRENLRLLGFGTSPMFREIE